MTTGSIPGVILSSRQTHRDARGRFVEIFRVDEMPEDFKQANHSHSKKGVLRGLHYHQNQADLWYVVAGRAQVGLADLRNPGSSPKTLILELDSADPATLYIPPGVAHGFLALTDLDLIYWVTQAYNPDDEFSVAWNDPDLSIPWLIDDPVLSERDAEAAHLTRSSRPS